MTLDRGVELVLPLAKRGEWTGGEVFLISEDGIGNFDAVNPVRGVGVE
jgi:hypothetical protein